MSKSLTSKWLSAPLERLYTIWLVLRKLGEVNIIFPTACILHIMEIWRKMSHHLKGAIVYEDT